MRFLSVCSGIEAASVAWNPLGWKAVAFSEIEPFPCAVLAHHYPDTPNWGDMTKYKEWPDVSIDLLCGGTPCQSFSVAGLRKGLDDPRGNLMLTFGSIAARYRPKWLVWENVPGVLSSNGGRDFGAFLGMLGQLGYGFAYRVLDAQYFGVAQRRRRVFVVGYLGDWRVAAAVLFERHSLSGHPAPSRQPGQEVAPTIRAGAPNDGAGHGARSGDSKDELIVPVTGTLQANGKAAGSATQQDAESGLLVAHSLRGEGFDASEDGTGRGTPLVPVAFDTTQITSRENGSNPRPGDPCHPLAAKAHAPAIAFPAKMSETQHASATGISPALCSLNPIAVSVSLRGRDGGATAELGDEVGSCLRASGGGGDKPHVLSAMAVRRLTPIECERLQGFPENYTLIPYGSNRAKDFREWISYLRLRVIGITEEEARSLAADGPRYKSIGNSWAVPNIRWIGARIAQADTILEIS